MEEFSIERGTIPAQVYLLELVETALLARKSFEEITEPLAQSFDESGLTEDEFDALIEEERQALWDEKHGKQ